MKFFLSSLYALSIHSYRHTVHSTEKVKIATLSKIHTFNMSRALCYTISMWNIKDKNNEPFLESMSEECLLPKLENILNDSNNVFLVHAVNHVKNTIWWNRIILCHPWTFVTHRSISACHSLKALLSQGSGEAIFESISEQNASINYMDQK